MTTAAIDAAQNSTPEIQRDLDRLRDATARVVGSVFFGTLLKTMRESPLKGPYGHGGRGEDIFMAQLHGVFAERAGASADYGLTETLYERLQDQQQRISTQRPDFQRAADFNPRGLPMPVNNSLPIQRAADFSPRGLTNTVNEPSSHRETPDGR